MAFINIISSLFEAFHAIHHIASSRQLIWKFWWHMAGLAGLVTSMMINHKQNIDANKPAKWHYFGVSMACHQYIICISCFRNNILFIIYAPWNENAYGFRSERAQSATLVAIGKIAVNGRRAAKWKLRMHDEIFGGYVFTGRGGEADAISSKTRWVPWWCR